ncbi:MAG: hypothetical protein L6R39_006486 [Caloplaca ligustica]|nr:MAG: hypothetical protein L6R39_006486 [Caloplaca ligustica]
MSAPAWLNDVHPLPNENGSFNPSTDPNAFMQMSSAHSIDYNAIQNQQYQQRLQNGNDPRNGSPAFQNPMYQTQPVVPTKRPRPREDSIGASPSQGPGMLPPSRSQTPQQGPYSGFQGAVNGAHSFQPPNPYHRFSNAGSNASLSPSLQSQQFNPQAPPARVQTLSPSPFSPATQNFGPQASPPPQSEHASRVNTPQNGAPSYVQGMLYGGNPTQPFNAPVNPNGIPTQPPQNIQQQQQRVQEIRQRQYLQQMQANNPAMQSRYPGMGVNPAMNASGQTPGMAAMGGRMQHPQQPNTRSNTHEQLVRNIAPWMQMRGLPFNPHPTAAGRPVNLMQLFQLVMRFGGSKTVTARSHWPAVAQHLQVPPAQFMMAAEELHNYWQNNMMHYESSYLQSQQQRQRAMQEQVRMQRPPPNGEIATAHDPYSPLKHMNAHLQDNQPHPANAQTPNQNGYLTPSKRVDHQQPDSRTAPLNGYLTPQQASVEARLSAVQTRPEPQLQNQSYPSQSQPEKIPIHFTKPAIKPKPKDLGDYGYPRRAEPREELFSPRVDNFKDEETDTLERHGGIHIRATKKLADEVACVIPDTPQLHELGVIDIRALTLSLKSGLQGEIRLALDTLCLLSFQMDLDLTKCEDLVDALIECAEDQVDLLAEHTAEVSDAMLINSYEDNIRSAKAENESLQVPPEYGSPEYDLQRAVDRLICITTILRNLSSFDRNCQQLASSTVIAIMTTVMRYLGTRNMLLRTHTNTVDFTKDAVVYLSNVSQHVDLPGKEEALSVLQFLLSFAPSPPPTNAGDSHIIFPAYEPGLHCYLPHAIDSFAKLLAKDEPNRGLFRSIFYADGSSVPPFELLTKAFGFAISVLPTYELNEARWEQFQQIIHARGPYITQGLLAAEIVVGLVPASEHSLLRAWLASQDGFAANLIKTVLFLGDIPRQPQNLPHPPRAPNEADETFAMVASRGIAVLRKLAERAKDAETDATGFPSGILPSKGSLLSNLLKGHLDREFMRQIYSYATLEV